MGVEAFLDKSTPL